MVCGTQQEAGATAQQSRFEVHRDNTEKLLPARTGLAAIPELPTRLEQKHRILEVKASRAVAASGSGKLPGICQSMKSMHETARRVLRDLTRECGPLEDLAALADIDWNGIEALLRVMDIPAASRSPSPSPSV